MKWYSLGTLDVRTGTGRQLADISLTFSHCCVRSLRIDESGLEERDFIDDVTVRTVVKTL